MKPYVLNEKIILRAKEALAIKFPISTNIQVIAAEPPLITIKHTKIDKDVVLTLKLGKVLSSHLSLTDKEVKEVVEEYKEINGELSSFKIKYSNDNYEEIYQTPLYAIGSTTQSCMTGMSCVQVYDYDENLELLTVWKDSKLVGRTLVAWRKHESRDAVYIRNYIDHNLIKDHQMKAILAKEGLVQGNLEGIKLRKIEENHYSYVCPYLDGNSTRVTEDSNYLIIDDYGEYSGTNTNGYLEDNTCGCEHCGERVHEDDINFIEDVSICNQCLEENYLFFNGEYYHMDNCITTSDTYITVPLCLLEEEDIMEDRNGDYYHSYNLVEVDGEWVHIDEAEELAIEEEDGNKRYAFKEDCFKVEVDLVCADKGFYLKEQLEEMVDELVALILNKQEELSYKGEFMLPNEELEGYLTAVKIIEELI